MDDAAGRHMRCTTARQTRRRAWVGTAMLSPPQAVYFVHVVDSLAVLNWPAGHAAHGELPSAEKDPAAQENLTTVHAQGHVLPLNCHNDAGKHASGEEGQTNDWG
eukprot:356761-Chlamydomonas_euryale.AAC.1